MGKDSACSAGDEGDVGSVPGSGRSPGGGHGNPLQYSCLENPMDRGAWRAAVHEVAQSRMGLSTSPFSEGTDRSRRDNLMTKKLTLLMAALKRQKEGVGVQSY